MATKPIPEMLHRAQIAIDNAMVNPLIQARLNTFGYPAPRMIVGKSLHEAAVAAVKDQIEAYGSQQQATAQVERARKEAEHAYQDLAKVARAIVGRERGILKKLGLDKEMPRSTAAFIEGGFTLFANAAQLPELADYGYDASKIAAERLKMEAYRHANAEQEAAKGAAQQATERQRAALKQMNEWVSRFLKIAHVAFREQPQRLEQLGILIRSGKTTAQRAAKNRPTENTKEDPEAPPA